MVKFVPSDVIFGPWVSKLLYTLYYRGFLSFIKIFVKKACEDFIKICYKLKHNLYPQEKSNKKGRRLVNVTCNHKPRLNTSSKTRFI